MSTAAKFRELNDLVAAATAKITDLEAKLAASEVEKAQLHEHRNAELSAREAAEKAFAELKAKHDQATNDLAVTTETSNEAIADLMAKLTAATAKLENPAFADASMKPVNQPATEGTPAAEGTGKTPTWDAYYAITDPGARTKFYETNKQRLITEAQLTSRK